MHRSWANVSALHGVSLVSRDSLARMNAVSSACGLDTTLLVPTRFSLGYAKGLDNQREPMATPEDNLIPFPRLYLQGFSSLD
jgi:hypothetical protein